MSVTTSGNRSKAPPRGALVRETFQTSRLMDFCSEKELTAQCGHEKADWPLVVGKELIDNALDTCEEADAGRSSPAGSDSQDPIFSPALLRATGSAALEGQPLGDDAFDARAADGYLRPPDLNADRAIQHRDGSLPFGRSHAVPRWHCWADTTTILWKAYA